MADLDPYTTLGVSRDAPDFVIQAAYRACLKRYHPDVYKGADAGQRTTTVIDAYALIGDETARARYDAANALGQNASASRGSPPPAPPAPATPPAPTPAPRLADSGWAVPVALIIIAFAIFGAIVVAGRLFSPTVAPAASATTAAAPVPDWARTPAAPATVGALPLLDTVIEFSDPSLCVMTKPTERLFAAMIKVDPKAFAGSRGAPIRIVGFAAPITPTFERRVTQTDGMDVRDDEATLTIGGLWHGLRVTKIRSRFMEYSSFWEMQVRFQETPEHVRSVLNGLGFGVPAIDKFKETSKPDEVQTGMGVELIDGGAALTCGSSMYY